MLVLGSRWFATILVVAGVLFLIYMGAVTWRSRPASIAREPGEILPPKKQVAFAMSVSLLNPHAILDTVGVIGTSSLNYAGTDKWAFALACILVSWIWFFGLALTGRLMGHLDRSGRLLVILNKASALIMWGTALYLASSLIR